MKGFLLGSLVLIALQTLLQPTAASTATSASNVLVAGLRRLLSSEVAGVPNRAKSSGTQTVEPPLPPSQGGPGILIPGNP